MMGVHVGEIERAPTEGVFWHLDITNAREEHEYAFMEHVIKIVLKIDFPYIPRISTPPDFPGQTIDVQIVSLHALNPKEAHYTLPVGAALHITEAIPFEEPRE